MHCVTVATKVCVELKITVTGGPNLYVFEPAPRRMTTTTITRLWGDENLSSAVHWHVWISHLDGHQSFPPHAADHGRINIFNIRRKDDTPFQISSRLLFGLPSNWSIIVKITYRSLQELTMDEIIKEIAGTISPSQWDNISD